MNHIIYNKEDFVSIADALREELNSEEKFSFPFGFIENISLCRNNYTTRKELTEYSSERNTVLAPYAFYNNEKLRNVNLPNVETIGDYCFYGCEALTEINIPSVKTIGKDAF